VILLLHYHSVEVNIYELGLSMPTPLASCHGHEFQRLETLHSSLQAVNAFFDNFLALPLHLARSLSFFTYVQIAPSMVLLHKLSTFESQDWNLDYVRETLNFGNIIDQLIGWFGRVQNMERVEQSSVEETEDIFSRTLRHLSRVKALHDQKTASSLLGPEIITTVPDADITMIGVSMDFLNDAWLEEMLGPWESQYNARLP
jgi:hypothetical protein